jgi:hypothetical protein
MVLLDVLAASETPFVGRRARNPPGKAGGRGERTCSCV